jgi:hypothetical protein
MGEENRLTCHPRYAEGYASKIQHRVCSQPTSIFCRGFVFCPSAGSEFCRHTLPLWEDTALRGLLPSLITRLKYSKS